MQGVEVTVQVFLNFYFFNFYSNESIENYIDELLLIVEIFIALIKYKVMIKIPFNDIPVTQ